MKAKCPFSDNRPGNKTPTPRRRFLKKAMGATAMGGLGFPMVSRAATTTLKMQGSWTLNDISNEMAMEYVERVNKMSGGRLRIDYRTAGTVVKSFQLQDAVHRRILDAGHTTTAYWYGKHKAASLFGTGPVFGANAAQILAWIHKGGGKELYRELTQEILRLDVVGFFAMPMPSQPLGWFQQRITSVQDLQRLKYRTVGLAADVMHEMGVKVTQVSGPETMPAMERGVIDAFEFNNPTSDRRIGAHDVSKVYMMGSYHQAAEFYEIIFNRQVFESLPGELQAILEFAAEAASTANYATAMDNFSKDLQKLITDYGVKVYRTPQSVMNAQLESWDKVLAKLSTDPFFKKIVTSQKAWARRVAFYDLVNNADYRLAFEHYFGKLAI